MVRQAALESFTKFAEQTVHETVVPDCMNRQSSLQDTVVAFLNKVSDLKKKKKKKIGLGP